MKKKELAKESKAKCREEATAAEKDAHAATQTGLFLIWFHLDAAVVQLMQLFKEDGRNLWLINAPGL